jgi:hypothetical protein
MNTLKQHETFISYSREDKDFALEFAREMKLAGHSVWLDQLDIPTGARWDDEVESALRECKIFLIILTPASVASENVKDEIGYAIDHGKRMMPVLLKECAVPLRLRRFQYIDFTRMEFGEGIKKAKQLLETLRGERSTPVGSVNPDYKPQKSPNPGETPIVALPNKNRPVPRQWIGIGAGILAGAACISVLGAIYLWKGSLFPSAPTQVPTAALIRTATEQQTDTTSTHPPSTSIAVPSSPTSEQINGANNQLGTPLQGCVVTTRFGARLQTEPDMSSLTMVDLPKDRQYEATLRSDAFPTWFYILHEGQGGWVSSQYLVVSSGCSD